MTLTRFIPIFAVLTLAVSAQAAVVVTPTSLTTNEGGGVVQFQVVLDSPPDIGETATVTPASDDATEGSVSGAINFTDADWNIPQYIDVSPIDDGFADGDNTYNITNTVTSNVGGGAYSAEAPSIVAVTNIDDEVANIIIEPSSIFVTEGGAAQSVTISAVGGSPSANITIDFTAVGGEAVSDAGASIVLTAGNGYSFTFLITANDDLIVDGDQAFSFTTDPSVSGDGAFAGINPADINGIAIDNDAVAPAADAVSAPTLSQWSQLLLLAMLAIIGLRYARQREA